MKFQTIKILLAIVAMLATVITTACPKSKTDALRSAIEASYRLPAATNDLIKDVADARDRGLISIEQARKFGDALNKLALAEVKFVEMVKVANEAFKISNAIDAATQSKLKIFFDADIVGPFTTVLETAKLISGSNASLITLGVAGVRILLHTIAGGIGSKASKRLLANSGGGQFNYFAREGRLITI